MGNQKSVEQKPSKQRDFGITKPQLKEVIVKEQPPEDTSENFKPGEDIVIKCPLDEMVKQFFESEMIVWHDPSVDFGQNQQYRQRLEKFCEVKTFTEWERASAFLLKVRKTCHVITSGTNGDLLVKEINSRNNVSRIYVFCENKDYHSNWAKNYQKVVCVKTDILDILSQIEQNLLELDKKRAFRTNFPAFAPIFNDSDKSEMNSLHLFLKVIPSFKNRKQAKSDVVALARAIYSDPRDLGWIEDFEKAYNEYKKEDILNRYTQPSFLYKIVNNCLRVATCDSIQYSRLLLKDIEEAIREQYQEKSKHFNGLLYRGTYLSEEEWSNLKANLNQEIEMHGFLSTSKDKNTAVQFIQNDLVKRALITIVVPKGPNEEEQGFADVEEFSYFPGEKEILFNVRSRFTVLEAEDEYSKDFPCRHLVLLYGAQGFRKFITEQNPIQEVSFADLKNVPCSTCQALTSEISSTEMFFLSLTTDISDRMYYCKKCLFESLEVNNGPFLCLSRGNGEEGALSYTVQMEGCVMRYPPKKDLQIPLYGYRCNKCQSKKARLYFKCTECSETWCEDCGENASSCIANRHGVVLETSPFSLWHNKMSEKELNHLKFQNSLTEGTEIFQQADMFFKSHQYEKAAKYFSIYIQQNKENENNVTFGIAYNNIGNAYKNQGQYKKALECHLKALQILRRVCGDDDPYVGLSYNNIGSIYYSQGQYSSAIEYHSKALELERSVYGDKNPNAAIMYGNIGSVYQSQGEYNKALEYYSKALEIERSTFGDNHPAVAASKINVGNIFCKQGKFEKAREHYSKALEIQKSIYGNNHPDVARSYNSLANVYDEQGEYKKALACYSEALEIRKSVYGDDHPDVATSYCFIGSAYDTQGEYNKAIEYHSKALEIRKSVHGENHPGVASAYAFIGSAFNNQGEYKKALEYFSKALEIKRSVLGDNHPEVASSYCNLGTVHDSLGEFKRAFECHSKAVEIQKSVFGESHPDVAISYNNIGCFYQSQAEYPKALEYHSKALAIRKTVYGDNHPCVANSYSNLGRVYESQREEKKALEYFSKALEIQKSALGDNHPEVATSSINIGNIYCRQEQYKKALEYYSKALEVRKLVHKGNHPEVATSYNNIGRVYDCQGEYKKALEYHLKALEIEKSVYGDSHPDVAISYNNIGSVYDNQGKYEKALEYYFKAVKIKSKVYGDDHPEVAISCDNIGVAYFKRGEPEKALEYFHKALKIFRLVYGDDHPQVESSYKNIEIASSRKGR